MRCEIAASLLHNPKILFLDEPTIGLDAVSKVAVREYIKRINNENGVTVMLTTHDMGDVEALTDRVMLIGRGKILYDGSFRLMKDRYNNINVLTIDYDDSCEMILPNHVSLISNEHSRAVISVETQKIPVSEVIGYLSQHLTVYDINVQSRPIEEIIAEIYEEYAI
jgi:ABC-2 type transport system ATP-binding protein